jgi:cell division protein FtsQ
VTRAGTTTRDRTREPAPTPAPRRPRRFVRRRGPRHPVLVAAVFPLLAATLAWVLWASPLLAVRTVQVDGVRTLSVAEVRDAAGLRTGTPLLRVDLDGATARVRRLPQVAAAEVSRSWPDRVVVTVTERVPVAVVERDGQRVLLDRDGVGFDTITGAAPKGVVPLAVAAPGPGDPSTRAALAALGALPDGVRTRLTQVAAATPQQVVLTLPGPVTVLWGDGGRAAAKAAALTALLDQVSAGRLGKAATIDVSAPDAVVLR